MLITQQPPPLMVKVLPSTISHRILHNNAMVPQRLTKLIMASVAIAMMRIVCVEDVGNSLTAVCPTFARNAAFTILPAGHRAIAGEMVCNALKATPCAKRWLYPEIMKSRNAATCKYTETRCGNRMLMLVCTIHLAGLRAIASLMVYQRLVNGKKYRMKSSW